MKTSQETRNTKDRPQGHTQENVNKDQSKYVINIGNEEQITNTRQ